MRSINLDTRGIGSPVKVRQPVDYAIVPPKPVKSSINWGLVVAVLFSLAAWGAVGYWWFS